MKKLIISAMIFASVTLLSSCCTSGCGESTYYDLTAYNNSATCCGYSSTCCGSGSW